jgi:hypothetical protein
MMTNCLAWPRPLLTWRPHNKLFEEMPERAPRALTVSHATTSHSILQGRCLPGPHTTAVVLQVTVRAYVVFPAFRHRLIPTCGPGIPLLHSVDSRPHRVGFLCRTRATAWNKMWVAISRVEQGYAWPTGRDQAAAESPKHNISVNRDLQYNSGGVRARQTSPLQKGMRGRGMAHCEGSGCSFRHFLKQFVVRTPAEQRSWPR